MGDNILRLSGRIELQAAAGDKPRRLSIVAYNGATMNVSGFGDVVLSLDGMTIPPSLPILADHRNEISGIVGTGSPVVSNGQLSVLATLADSPAAASVVGLLASGVDLQASVGAVPTQRKYLSPGQAAKVNGRDVTAGAKGLTLIEKSTLREISITPLGADATTSVSLAAKQKGEQQMNENATPPGGMSTQRTEDEILRAERTRVLAIEKASAGFESFEGVQQIRAKALEGTATVDDVNRAALEAIRASRPKFEGGSFVPGLLIAGTARGNADPKSVLTAALMTRCGFEAEAEKQLGAGAMEVSRPLHRASLPDLCAAALRMDHRDVPVDRNEMIRAALSTGSMPTSLSNTANKILSATYRTAPSAWRSFAAVKSAGNFKPHTSLRPTFAGDLSELPNNGEIEHQSFSEETFSWQVGQYARQLRIGRKDIVNDDAGVFGEVIPSMARAAARTLSALVATTILANGGSFWSTGHLNFQEGSGTALSSSSLASAIKLLRNMRDAEGSILDMEPKVLLVPSDLEPTARALLQSNEVLRVSTDQLPTGNIYRDAFQLAVEPRLSSSDYSGYSTTAWWLFSDPMNAAVVVAFLDGRDAPTIETFDFSSDPNQLAMTFRCVFDFGCALGDYRASIRSKGAA